jgi:alkanesulfonate monooxygenase SsuD/methylene tetrahydromethanopterin reductase-like flavin-dependent oxidoreductase (luciferase family)
VTNVDPAREAATLDLLTEGRFELGLGAGRTDNGYASLGVRPDPGGVRVRRVPLLLAAGGRRAIELAGREADIVAIGARSGSALAEQLEWMRAAAGERYPRIELGMRFWVLPDGDEQARRVGTATLRGTGVDLDEMIRAGAPGVVMGSPAGMADQLEERRASFGLSYVVVNAEVMDTFAPVVERLAGR